MTKKSQLASTDPTFETQGPMGIFLCNRTDNGSANAIANPPTQFTGMYTLPSIATLNFGPGQPPRPWGKGTDWKLPTVPSGGAYMLAPDQFPSTNGSNVWSMGGSACVLSVSDRSTKKVAPDAEYNFDQPFMVGLGTQLSIHFTILPVTGGSTVLPGFGLWNLTSRPGAWTYLAPTSFDGIWSLQLRSDDFVDYATLSVTYVRYSTMTSGTAMSRLFYSISGSAAAKYPFKISPSLQLDEAPDSTGAPPEQGSSIDIFRASTEYKEFGI